VPQKPFSLIVNRSDANLNNDLKHSPAIGAKSHRENDSIEKYLGIYFCQVEERILKPCLLHLLFYINHIVVSVAVCSNSSVTSSLRYAWLHMYVMRKKSYRHGANPIITLLGHIQRVALFFLNFDMKNSDNSGNTYVHDLFCIKNHQCLHQCLYSNVYLASYEHMPTL
jgi:hypothetical protein